MKKIYSIITLVLFSISTYAINVTFSVDMRYQTVSPNGVHVSGDFQLLAGFSGNWDPGATTLTNVAGTSIYSVTVNIPANAKYEYRFINGDQEYESEFIPEKSRVGFNFNDNRWIYIDSTSNSTLELPSVIFGGNAAFGKKLIRLSVDLQKQTVLNTSDIKVLTHTMYSFYDKIYEIQVYVDSNETLNYTFSNGGVAESLSIDCNTNGYRTFTVTADTLASIVCFASCTDCASTGVQENLNANTNISVFPNPAADFTKIVFGNASNRNIFLYDIQGRMIKEFLNSNNSELVLNTMELNAGVYLLNIQENESFHNIKLIVQ